MTTLVRIYRDHPWRSVAALFVMALLTRLAAAPFGAPADPDTLWYLIKARELTHGNFTPSHIQAIGWPIALAPVLFLAPHAQGMTLMNLGRVAGCVAGAAIVGPAAWLSRETLDERAQPIALILTAWSLLLVRMAVRGFVEPLLTLLLVTAIAGVLASARGARSSRLLLVAGASAAGFASWIHPTGITATVYAAIVASIVYPRRARLAAATVVVVVALAIAAPPLVQRARTYGGPFEYGLNNPPVPRPIEVMRGATAVLRTFAVDVVQLPVFVFFLIGVWRARRAPELVPLVVVVALFLVSWFPLFTTFAAGRYLTPVLPFALALAAAGLVDAASRFRRPGAATTAIGVLLVTYVVAYSIVAIVQRQRALHDEFMDGLTWGRWVADHVRGRLALTDGQEVVMMNVADATVGGVVSGVSAPRTGLSVVKYPDRMSIDEAMAWLRAEHVTHLVVDDIHDVPPGIRWLRDGPVPPFLIERFSTRGSDSRWPIRIFEIRWDGGAGYYSPR